jgi:hypothetical protein
MEARQTAHTFIFVDETGFNLAKTRRGGRNVIGQRATVDVPAQRGANIAMCAALSNDGLLLHKPLIWPLCCSSHDVSSIPASILPLPKPHRGVCLCMEVEGL